MRVLEKEKKTPYFQSTNEKQFLQWHAGICNYYLTQQASDSIRILKSALQLTGDLTNSLNEREIEIVNSIAIIYNEIDEFYDSIKYYKIALSSLKRLPQLKEHKIYIRVLYGISKSYKGLKQYDNSIYRCNKGIELCKKYETFYLYGELEYQKGKNYLHQNKVKLAQKHMNIAMLIFELEGHQPFINHVQKELNKINK